MRIFASIMLAGFVLAPLIAEAQEQTPHAETLRGVVEHVDYANGTIDVVDSHGHAATVATSPGTTITGSKQAGYEELSDIRSGAHVTIEASKVDSRLDAVLIKIHDSR